MNSLFDWSLLGAPLIAGLLVVATHVALGREVLRRGIIFIDLTIAQIAALGVILVEVCGVTSTPLTQQFAAGVAAMVAALVLSWTERMFRDLQEALIGSLYVVSASLAIVLLASNPHGAEHFNELLAGQILWTGWPQVYKVAALYAVVLAAWYGLPAKRQMMFYVLFALTVTASVQLVGVYLVFASLILPALAAQQLAGARGLWLGYGIGAAGYAVGLTASVPADLPSGPLVVVALAFLSLVAGVVTWAIRSRFGAKRSAPA
jgi:zinc/manganese transport system permease protein